MSFARVLAVDWETSGLHRDTDSVRSYDSGPQGIDLGAVVVDTESWTKIGDFSSRVQFSSSMLWDKDAERIHGIRQTDLVDSPSTYVVAERFDEFLGNFYQRGEPILLAGQNPSVDRWFTHQLFHRAGYDPMPWRFHSRMIDTFTLGFLCWGCTTGDQLYRKVCGVIRKRHSAYEDADLGATVLCEAFRLNSLSI